MRFPEMTSTQGRRIAENGRKDILRALGLKEGGTKLKILKELSEEGRANVYELWKKRLPNVGHYSTVLRALKSLEQKRLVMAHKQEDGRTKIIYATTVLGTLIAVLADSGWGAVAQIIAEKSPSFRQCILAHFSRDPFYYWPLSRDIIKEIKLRVIISDPTHIIEESVRWIEIEWIKEHIVQQINEPSSRPWLSNYLKSMSHLDWIKSELLPFLDDYITGERVWLGKLEEYKKDLLSSEERPKLPQFFVDE